MHTLHSSLDQLVSRMIDGASLPKYQFERASEPLVTMFIAEWLSEAQGIKLSLLTTEFPLKKEADNASTNADYLLAAECGDLYLIELKTTTGGLRPEQVRAYDAASSKNGTTLLKNVRAIADSPNASKKYPALLRQLPETAEGKVWTVFVTPHKTRPAALGQCDHILWQPLSSFFEFESKLHPELWKYVKRLRAGIAGA